MVMVSGDPTLMSMAMVLRNGREDREWEVEVLCGRQDGNVRIGEALDLRS